jgi:predicted transcriptional regulator YdeE
MVSTGCLTIQKVNMDIVKLEQDVVVMYIEVTNFPNGVVEAFDKLESLYGSGKKKLYGISFQDRQGKIIYRAAAEVRDETEAAQFGLPHFTIKRGTYLSEKIENFLERIDSIGETFMKMIHDTRIDPKGYCVEVYQDPDVICMVRLVD